jgi:hypothetical protein
MPKTITELWAWIGVDADGDEGIAAHSMMVMGQAMMMPLVGADLERMRSLEPHARAVATLSGSEIRLRRFKVVSDA